MDNFIFTNLPPEVLEAALASDDDVGIYFRAHHLIEQAAEKAAEALYEKYGSLQHDSLHKHLNALEARGAQGPVFRAARTVANHRRPFAHTRTFLVTDAHVAQVRSQLEKPDVDAWAVPIKGQLVDFKKLRPAHQYLVLALSIAGTIDIIGVRYRELFETTQPDSVSAAG